MSDKPIPPIPPNLRYTQTHEWVKLADGEVLVGVTAYAVEEMGRDIVHIDLPAIGLRVRQRDSCGVIDSVKASFDLYAPVSGEVVAVNTALNDSPSLIAESPYDRGWIVRIKPVAVAELDNNLTADAYKAMIQSGAAGH